MNDILTKPRNVWEFLELPTKYEHTRALFSWGLNCDPEGNPWLLFLDLIEFDEYCRFAPANSTYGFVELDYLADALREYCASPRDVETWITTLMECDR